MQRPLVEGIHPQHGDIARGRAVVRQRLDKIAVLIKIARGVAAHANVDGALQSRRVGGVIVALGVIHHRDGRAQQRTAVVVKVSLLRLPSPSRMGTPGISAPPVSMSTSGR